MSRGWRIASTLDHRAFVGGVLALGALLRLALILAVDNQPVSDCAWSYDRARDLAAGHGYSYPPADAGGAASGMARVPTAYWPVGYPGFLAGIFVVFGPSVLAGQLANVALSLGVMLLAGRLAAELFGSARIGRLTLLALAVYPNHIAYSAILYGEPLFLFVLLIALTAWIESQRAHESWWWTVACGVAFGVATLIKPQVVLLPAFLLAIDAVRLVARRGNDPRRFGRAAVMTAAVYACVLLTIAPWVARNYQTFGRMVVSTNSGRNLLIGNHPGASGGYMNALGRPYPEVFGLAGESESDLAAAAAAFQFVQEQPLHALALWPKKLLHLYLKDVEGFYWIGAGLSDAQPGTRQAVFVMKLIAQACYCLAFLAFGASILDSKARRSTPGSEVQAPGLGLAVIVFFTVIYLPYFGDSRFHFPAMPFVLMYGCRFALSRLAPSTRPGPAPDITHVGRKVFV